MLKKTLFLVLAIAILMPPISRAEIVCEQGHVFIWNGRWYCNPGPGPEGCLRCYDSITVGAGCSQETSCVENPTP